jgi:hypothetical protein
VSIDWSAAERTSGGAFAEFLRALRARAREADARTELSLYQRAGYEHNAERIFCSKESWRGALRAMTLNLAAYVARRRTRPTCTWVHSLPRAVRMPRLFNASAMAFRLLAPAFWISRTSGSRFAAN